MQTISKGQDVVDSRDVIERIEELTGYRDDAQTAAEEHNTKLAELEQQLTAAETDEDRERLTQEIEDNGPKQEQVFSLDGDRQYWASDEYQDEEEEELHELLELAEEGEGSPDWSYGETLIADSYFTEYAQQLAEDIGAISKESQWPNNHIDWEAAADALQQDYMCVSWGDQEYWIRA
jgi:hypothetical protein